MSSSGDIKKLLTSIDEASAKFSGKLPAIERRMLEEVLLLARGLEVKSGKVASSMANLKLINSMRGKLEKLVLSREYIKDVSELARSCNTIAAAQQAYFKSSFGEFSPKPYYDAIRDVAISNTIEALTESGIRANVLKPINDLLRTGVTSGMSYAQMEQSLRRVLTETDGGSGALSRYAKTYAVDSVAQFAGEYMAAITADLKTDWFVYRGSNIETTREFCELLTKKEYIHRSEIPEILNGHIDGHKCKIYERTGLPYGMKEGTTPDNFMANRGGWNCQHQLIPLSESSVPEIIRNTIKMQQDIEKLSAIKRSEDVLYSDITGGIASMLVRLVNEKMEGRTRVKILSEIVENKGFEQKYQNAEKGSITKIFGTIKEHDAEYGDNVNAAKSLNSIGYDVYVLPRVSGSKSFDYILVKDKKMYAAELKTIYGKNSIDHRLEKASEQSDRVILNIVGNITSRNAADKIRSFYLSNPQIQEVIVLKSGKPIYVRHNQVQRKNFVEDFMKRWAW